MIQHTTLSEFQSLCDFNTYSFYKEGISVSKKEADVQHQKILAEKEEERLCLAEQQKVKQQSKEARAQFNLGYVSLRAGDTSE